jgi:hypothetical protein
VIGITPAGEGSQGLPGAEQVDQAALAGGDRGFAGNNPATRIADISHPAAAGDVLCRQ